MMSMDQDLAKARSYVQEKIFSFLVKRHQQPISDAQMQKLKDFVKRLEEALFKAARSQEDYMNMETLESRMVNLIRRGNRHPSSSAMATMIPTPGMPHAGISNINVTSSLDATANATNRVHTIPVTSSTLLPNGDLHNGTLNRADGSHSNGYQQEPSHFSLGSGGYMAPLGMQRINSQMIPTPAFNNNSNNQDFLNAEASNNSGRFPSAESSCDKII